MFRRIEGFLIPCVQVTVYKLLESGIVSDLMNSAGLRPPEARSPVVKALAWDSSIAPLDSRRMLDYQGGWDSRPGSYVLSPLFWVRANALRRHVTAADLPGPIEAVALMTHVVSSPETSRSREAHGPSGSFLEDHKHSIAMVLFVISGASALMLEIVWSRMLGWLLGATTWSVMATLVAFMGGLGIGGILWGRWASRSPRPLRTFGRIEIAVGLYTLMVPVIFEWLGAGFVMASRFVGESPESAIAIRVVTAVLAPGAADPVDGRHASCADAVRLVRTLAAGTRGGRALCGEYGGRGVRLLSDGLFPDLSSGSSGDQHGGRRSRSRRRRIGRWSGTA